MADQVKLNCPFCGKSTIDAIFYPSMLETRTAYGASRRGAITYYTKEKYEIQSGCSNCGKSQKEVQKALKEGKKEPDKEKKILERLKEQGFSSEITTKF
jgi:hypothetical protein